MRALSPFTWIVVDAPPAGAKVITMTDEEIAKAPLPDGKGAVRALLQGTKREKMVEYELTPDGRLLVDAKEGQHPLTGKASREPSGGAPMRTEDMLLTGKAEQTEAPGQPSEDKMQNPSGGHLLDLLASRADYFSEDAMEFILSAIDSGVDERAVKRMISMDEEQLLQICGEVG